MEKKIRVMLEEDFPESMIKQRRGRTGGSIAYVGSPAFIQRLNDSFDGDWPFEIVEWHELHGEAIVLGRVTSPGGIVKEQFGNSTISVYGTKHERAGEIISFGDDLKAAASDAMKKCATLFGVGLSVYGGEKAGIKKEGSEEPDPKSAILANIQRGEEALSEKLNREVSNLRNNHFGVDGDIANYALPKLRGYETYLRSLRDEGTQEQGRKSTQKETAGDKGADDKVWTQEAKVAYLEGVLVKSYGKKLDDLRNESAGTTELTGVGEPEMIKYETDLRDLIKVEQMARKIPDEM